MSTKGMKYKGTTCKVDGCDRARWDGTRLAMCEPHAREHMRELWRRSHARRQADGGKQGRREKRKTEAAKPTAAPARTLRFLLVDEVTGEVLRVSGVVEQRVAFADLRSGKLHQETANLFMRKGFMVGERKKQAS